MRTILAVLPGLVWALATILRLLVLAGPPAPPTGTVIISLGPLLVGWGHWYNTFQLADVWTALAGGMLVLSIVLYGLAVTAPLSHRLPTWFLLGLGVAIGGAVSNMMEKIIYSYVVDYLAIARTVGLTGQGPGIATNLADLCLYGGLLLAALSLLGWGQKDIAVLLRLGQRHEAV